MDVFSSSYSIIKALKGSDNSSTSGGLSKIEIASKAWESTSISFPKKDEVLAEWILGSFAKHNNEVEASRAVIFSGSYWSLLSKILSANSPSKKVWLSPLLNRTSIPNIVDFFFKHASDADEGLEDGLIVPFTQCMQVLWALSASRTNLDALTACLGSILAFVYRDVAQLNKLAAVSVLVERSFKKAVGNTSSKRKAFALFMQQSFAHWAYLVCIELSVPIVLERDAKLFKSEVYQAGVEVFFHVDALRSSDDPLQMILSETSSLVSNVDSSQTRIIPMLYGSYLQEIRKHRSVIFGSSSSHAQEQTVQNKLRDVGMRAFISCYRALCQHEDAPGLWKCKLALVETLAQANVVNYGLSEKTDILSEIAATAIDVLGHLQDSRNERAEPALRILCVLSRIDFDLISPLVPHIFSGLLTLNPTIYPAVHELLDEILDFHSKTRTLPHYLNLLLECLSGCDKALARYSNVQFAHRHCTSGALLSFVHLEHLSRCIKGFLTPGQAQEAVNSALAQLRSTLWEAGNDSARDEMDVEVTEASREDEMETSVDRERNRRKIDALKSTDPAEMTTSERRALAYSLVARAVSVILPSVPFSSLTEATCGSIQTTIEDTWTGTIDVACRAAFAVGNPTSTRWAEQAVSAASLRIRHALLMSTALRSIDAISLSIVMTESTVSLIRAAETTPELVVELFRGFFDLDYQNISSTERDDMNDALLAYLAANLELSDSVGRSDAQGRPVWDASSSSLDLSESGGHVRGALAVFHLLLERWLPILEEIASQEHLRRVSRMLLSQIESCSTGRSSSGGLSAATIVERAVRSAVFWELQNVREAMIYEMDSTTQFVDWAAFQNLLEAQWSSRYNETKRRSSQSLPILDTQKIRAVSSSFSALLLAPREYLTRNSRISFIRRALVIDLSVSLFERDSKAMLNELELEGKTRKILRLWITSISETVDIVDVVGDELVPYIEYLMQAEDQAGNAGADSSTVTLDLLSTFFRQITRSIVNVNEDQFRRLCAFFQEFSSSLAEKSLMRFVEILTADCNGADKLSSRCLEAVNALHSNMNEKYLARLLEILPSLSSLSNGQTFAIQSWRVCLILRKWLNTSTLIEVPTLGAQVVQRLMTSTSDWSSAVAKPLCTEIFMLLLEELQIVSKEKRKQHLALIVSAYILLIGRLNLADEATCDASLGRTVRSTSAEEFAFALSLLREAIQKGLASNGELRAAVHLSSVFMSDAPEGTLKVTQEHFDLCLHAFCGDSKFVADNADISVEALTLIGKVCSEKPASLRVLTLGPIWLILAKLSTGSKDHSTESHPRILHAITSIAASLIRLRRDLVTSTLPHLGLVLRSLIRSLCAPRPQLGARQRGMVADTLPWWISPTKPLGIPEARAVARLLTALQAKTIPRTFASRVREKEKERGAESMLGAFSKHAAPVLNAYIDALVDPLVLFDVGMRDALAPGLYALCEAMGEHGRDSLMVSGCDATGKTVLKALWRDYEKQRYVGKG